LESAGSQAAEPNDGRGAKSELLLLLFLVFREDGTAKYVLEYAPQCECFSATIRSRAECPPSPVVFFPQLALFSSNRIHPETKHLSPSCLLPPARSFFLIHIGFIQKQNIHLPVVFFPSSLFFSHPYRNSLISSQLSSSPVHYFSDNRIHPDNKNIHLPNCLLPKLAVFSSKKNSSRKKNIHLPNCLLPKLALFSASNRIHQEKKNHSSPSYVLS
jgi:hypothetical protein